MEFTRGCPYVQVVADHDMEEEEEEEEKDILGSSTLIKEMYVHEEHRGLGIARYITDFAVTI